MGNGKARKRRALAGAQNWRCAYCLGAMREDGTGPSAATIEHLIPRSRGGSEDNSNLVVACRGCNGARPSHHSASQFFELRQALLTDGQWAACAEPVPALAKRIRQVPGIRGQERVRFTLDEVFDHIEQRHPGCPSVFRGELAHLVAGRRWVGASIGKAFGITATGFVRDSFTAYKFLRDIAGVEDADARLVVRPEVARILASWGKPAI